MSNALLTAVFDHSRTRHAARLLMLALADRADDSGTAWPSIGDIMRRTGLSRGTVHGAMRKAVELGELSVDHFAGPKLCNRYKLHVGTRSDIEPRSDSEPVQILHRPVQILDITRSDSEPKPSVTLKNPQSLDRPSRKAKPTTTEDPDFAAFWTAYPRKTAKPAALKAWRATAKGRPPLAELIAALEKHKASRQWQDPQFVAHPATWLRGQRWLDELKAATEPKPARLRL
jgi:hypothetical protein